MRLVYMMGSFVTAHVMMSITQLFLLFLLSGVATYGGDSGFMAYTPLETYVTDERGDIVNAIDLPGMLLHFVRVGNTVFGLVAFEYSFLMDIQSSEGLVFWVVLLIRIATWFSTILAGAALAEIIFKSGLLQSSLGAGLVLGGLGLTAGLGVIGAID